MQFFNNGIIHHLILSYAKLNPEGKKLYHPYTKRSFQDYIRDNVTKATTQVSLE